MTFHWHESRAATLHVNSFLIKHFLKLLRNECTLSVWKIKKTLFYLSRSFPNFTQAYIRNKRKNQLATWHQSDSRDMSAPFNVHLRSHRINASTCVLHRSKAVFLKGYNIKFFWRIVVLLLLIDSLFQSYIGATRLHQSQFLPDQMRTH